MVSCTVILAQSLVLAWLHCLLPPLLPVSLVLVALLLLAVLVAGVATVLGLGRLIPCFYPCTCSGPPVLALPRLFPALSSLESLLALRAAASTFRSPFLESSLTCAPWPLCLFQSECLLCRWAWTDPDIVRGNIQVLAGWLLRVKEPWTGGCSSGIR